MKNILYTLCLSFLILVAANHTAKAQLLIRSGVKGGFNASGMVLTQKIDQAINPGFHFGLFVWMPLSKKLGVKSEVLYTQKGYMEQQITISGQANLFFNSNYLEVPILLQTNLGGDGLQAFFNVGPSIGYWLSGKTITRFPSTNESPIKTDIVFDTHEYNRIELSLNAGIGVLLPLQKMDAFLEVRYGQGLSNMQANLPANFVARNQVISATVGLMFGRGDD